MRTMGVDFDTKRIAFAVLDDGEVVDHALYLPPGRSASDRFGHLIGHFQLIISKWKPDKIVIEDTPFVKNRAGFGSLAQLLGGLRAVACLENYDVTVMPGRDWKRAIGLGANASKDDISSFTAQLHPISELWSQDERDAYCIALALNGG